MSGLPQHLLPVLTHISFVCLATIHPQPSCTPQKAEISCSKKKKIYLSCNLHLPHPVSPFPHITPTTCLVLLMTLPSLWSFSTFSSPPQSSLLSPLALLLISFSLSSRLHSLSNNLHRLSPYPQKHPAGCLLCASTNYAAFFLSLLSFFWLEIVSPPSVYQVFIPYSPYPFLFHCQNISCHLSSSQLFSPESCHMMSFIASAFSFNYLPVSPLFPLQICSQGSFCLHSLFGLIYAAKTSQSKTQNQEPKCQNTDWLNPSKHAYYMYTHMNVHMFATRTGSLRSLQRRSAHSHTHGSQIFIRASEHTHTHTNAHLLPPRPDAGFESHLFIYFRGQTHLTVLRSR